MKLLARARRFFARTTGRLAGRTDDPADMGTAFGLEATTSLEPYPAEAAPQPEPVTAAMRFALRVHRRSSV